MPTEDDVVEVSTPSANDTGATGTAEHHDPGEIVQRDQESRRRSIGEEVRAAVKQHTGREPSPARQAAAAARSREEGTQRFSPEQKDGKDKPAAQSPAKVEQAAPKDGALAPAAATQSPAAKPGEQQTADSSPAAGVPTSWSKEAKDVWTSLPPAVQQAVAKREKEVADGFANYQGKTREIDQAFAPYDPLLQRFGRTRAQAVSQMMGWHDALGNPRTQAEAFRALARSHNFDLSTLVQNPEQSPQQADPNDPRVLLRQYVDPMLTPMQQELQMLRAERQQEMQARFAEQSTKVNSDIAAFAKDKPDFDRVKVRMGQLIAVGAASGLQDAYDQARWADPETRAEIQAEAEAKREAESKAASEAASIKAAAYADAKRKADLAAAQKARQANVSVRGSTPSGNPRIARQQGNRSVRDSVRATVEALRG